MLTLISFVLPSLFGTVFPTPVNKDVPLPLIAPRSIVDYDPFGNETAPACTTLDNEQSINSGIIGSRYRWKYFYVYPDPSYNDNERRAINNAMYNLQQVLPCVEFGMYTRDADPSGDYIHIQKGNGCSSPIGRRGGRQTMSLRTPGCMSIGTIMHEMIHALGFKHEQARPDRDDHVAIYWENIESGKEHNFEKTSTREYSTYGVAYDQNSIMHYGSYSFSKNDKATILAWNGETVGSKGRLQESDKQKLKNMYKC